MSYQENTYQSSDGLNLYYRDYGDADTPGVPVLCLHGLTRSSRDFDDLATRLSTSRRVIVPDFRGRGRSDYDPNIDNYNAAVYAKDALALLDHLGIEKVATIGTSLGGIVTMVIALIKPEVIAGSVLNDIGPVVDTKGLDHIGGHVGLLPAPQNWDDAVKNAKVAAGKAYPDFTDEDWLWFARMLHQEDDDGGPLPNYDPAIGDVMRKTGSGGELWHAYQALGDRPVLTIRGEISDILSPETLDRMSREIPNARMAIIPRTGHAPLLDEPECLIAIDDLLEAVDS